MSNRIRKGYLLYKRNSKRQTQGRGVDTHKPIPHPIMESAQTQQNEPVLDIIIDVP